MLLCISSVRKRYPKDIKLGEDLATSRNKDWMNGRREVEGKDPTSRFDSMLLLSKSRK